MSGFLLIAFSVPGFTFFLFFVLVLDAVVDFFGDGGCDFFDDISLDTASRAKRGQHNGKEQAFYFYSVIPFFEKHFPKTFKPV